MAWWEEQGGRSRLRRGSRTYMVDGQVVEAWDADARSTKEDAAPTGAAVEKKIRGEKRKSSARRVVGMRTESHTDGS